MEFFNIMKRLKLNRMCNVVIYISFTLLIISLLFPLQGIENSVVQRASIIFLIFGFYLLIVRNVTLDRLKHTSRSNRQTLKTMRIILEIVGFIIALKLAF